MDIPIVLASGSPRRIELLKKITSRFIPIASKIDEKADGSPEEQVISVARDKARQVATENEGIIIGADTIVVVDNEILGKPNSREQARRMLTKLSAREHTVITGLYILSTRTKQYRQACEKTKVHLCALAKDQIEAYLDTGEYVDKAGAYAIQGQGALFIDRICGDFFNVMGLPVCKLYLLLREMGVSLELENSNE
ncbi:MAG: Maf family protein [Candidatus Bipolaricaulota bacterium]